MAVMVAVWMMAMAAPMATVAMLLAVMAVMVMWPPPSVEEEGALELEVSRERRRRGRTKRRCGGAERGRTIFLGFHLTLKIDLVSPCFFALFDWVTQRRRIYILLHTTPQERGFCASKY